jgi:hypothetical protein
MSKNVKNFALEPAPDDLRPADNELEESLIPQDLEVRKNNYFINRSNNKLRRIWKEGVKNNWRVGDVRAWTAAQIRIALSRLRIRDYVSATGITTPPNQGIERPDAEPQYITIGRILDHCDTLAEDNPLIRDRIHAAQARILDTMLVQDKDTVIGLYREWMYRGKISSEDFDKRTGLRVRDWYGQRNQDLLSDFSQLIHVAKSLGLIENGLTRQAEWEHPAVTRAREVWANEAERKRKRAKPVSLLHAALHHLNIKTTWDALKKDSGLSSADAKNLFYYNFIPWEVIEKFFGKTLREGIGQEEYEKLKIEWQREYTHSGRPYSDMINDLYAQKKASNVDLARVMNIKVNNPADRVSQVLNGMPCFKLGVAPGIMNRLLGDSSQDIHELDEAFLAHRRSHQERKQVTSAIRDARQLWAVTPASIQDQTGYTKEELLEIENGHRAIASREEEQIVSIIDTVGQKRLADARRRWNEERHPTTMQKLTSVHWNPLRRARRQGKLKGYLSEGMVRQIANGENMISLHTLKHVLIQSEMDSNIELEQDCSFKYAEKLEREGHPPLVRVLRAIIAEHAQTRWDFVGKDKAFDERIRMCHVNIIDGKSYNPVTIPQILETAGIKVDSPRWLFVHALCKTNDIPLALKEWESHMRETQQHSTLDYRDLPGLTSSESPYRIFKEEILDWIDDTYPHITQRGKHELQTSAAHFIIRGQDIPSIREFLSTRIQEQEQAAQKIQIETSYLIELKLNDPRVYEHAKNRLQRIFRRESHRGDRSSAEIATILHREFRYQRILYRLYASVTETNHSLIEAYEGTLRATIRDTLKDGDEEVAFAAAHAQLMRVIPSAT